MPRLAMLLAALAVALSSPLARPAAAEPVLVTTSTPQAGGLVEHAVSIDFRDGEQRSGFIEISFVGNFTDGSLALSYWPDVLEPPIETSSLVQLRGGTGGGSQVLTVPIATLTVATGTAVSYSAVASRDGLNYVLVPEPGASVAAAAGLLTTGLLRARRRVA